MERSQQPDVASDQLYPSSDVEVVAQLTRGDERLDVRAYRRPNGIEYRFDVGGDEGRATQTVQQQSFSDEGEAQTYLQAELTRLVGEGWQRARPELGAESDPA